MDEKTEKGFRTLFVAVAFHVISSLALNVGWIIAPGVARCYTERHWPVIARSHWSNRRWTNYRGWASLLQRPARQQRLQAAARVSSLVSWGPCFCALTCIVLVAKTTVGVAARHQHECVTCGYVAPCIQLMRVQVHARAYHRGREGVATGWRWVALADWCYVTRCGTRLKWFRPGWSAQQLRMIRPPLYYWQT